MLILYGSQTGTAESYAKIVHSFAKARGLNVRMMPASSYDLTNLPLEEENIVLFITSTFYNGEFPNNFNACWEYLKNEAPSMLNLKFGVFGLGCSTTKDNFNRAAKSVRQRLLELEAVELIPPAYGDDTDPCGHETAFRPWIKSLWTSLLGEDQKMTLPVHYDVRLFQKDAPRDLGPTFQSIKVLGNELLTAEGYERPTYLITMELPEGMTYQTGDHVQIVYKNPDSLVERAARCLRLDLDTIVQMQPLEDNLPKTFPTTAPVTVRAILRDYLDLASPPSRSFLEGLSALCTNPEEAAYLQNLAEDMGVGNLYMRYVSGGMLREPFTLIDVLEDHPSIKIRLDHLLGNVRPIMPRYYSICSSHLQHPTTIQVSYMVDQWYCTKDPNTVVQGAAAGFLAHLAPGDFVTAKTSRGSFKIPDSLYTPIIGVALGTGIAFFRALLQHREQQHIENPDAPVTPLRLYYGVRHAKKDLLFKEELDKYQEEGLLELISACSHDTAAFITPATKLAEHPEKVCEYLDNGGYYFYCGIGGVIPNYHEASILHALQEGHGDDTTPAIEAALIENLKETGHWQVEAFSRSLDHENALQQAQDVVMNKDRRPIADVLKDCAMFCYQCAQTSQGVGCTKIGVCGKTPSVAALQDLLIDHIKHLSWYSHQTRSLSSEDPEVQVESNLLTEVDNFIVNATFTTLTNANFDAPRFVSLIDQAIAHEEALAALYSESAMAFDEEPLVAPWLHRELPNGHKTASEVDIEDLVSHSKKVGVLSRLRLARNDALVGLQEMLVYGLKGVSAFMDLAAEYNKHNAEVSAFIAEAYSFLLTKEAASIDNCIDVLMKCGKVNITAMELLHEANASFGAQTPATVAVKPVAGKAILVSGQDLKVIRDLLAQCASYKAITGEHVNVFTHGELLTAHAYADIRETGHLAGHFGSAWQRQSMEFGHFPGAILMTTNCLTPPQTTYKDRLFTSGSVGYTDIPHIADDYVSVIQKAIACAGFTEDDESFTYPPNPFIPEAAQHTVGWSGETLLEHVDTIVDAVKAGTISRFYLIGGTDGYDGERTYYTELAAALPPTSVILTFGCAKYRMRHLDLGEIGDTGIPRLIDLGQVNDVFSVIKFAQALSEKLGCIMDDLPISTVLSWFEQKAVAVMLTLLSLGWCHIRGGPTTPAFLRPSIFTIMHDRYNLKMISVSATRDVTNMIYGA
ncbi:Hydroxylamine reductase [Thraustotheca clavata]|uniref:Hydroxylamine reductase n=1 Tax=Thraustotheca clavata TaxID=74557 RepID=A0A1W0A605_9STRA|nr:Hydroxylamine reductase [Thraustotheca clavata]